jgi:predicted NBD/HSP70 family sugar kinase
MANIIDKYSGPFNAERLGGTKGLGVAAEKIQELMTKNGIEPERIQGIGVSVPGIVSQKGHELVSPPLLKNWFETDIPVFLARKLRIRSNLICVENDANLGALGESRYGLVQGKSISDLVYIKIGIGIGLGRIKNNQIDRGHNGAAGEIGHIIVKYEWGDECPSCGKRIAAECPSCGRQIPDECPSCGRRGDLESVAAEYAIIKAARERNASLHLKSTSSLSPDRLEDLTSIIEAAKGGNHACAEALKTAARYIGTVIGSFIMNVLNPDVVIVDGDIIRISERLGEPLFLDCIQRTATNSSLPSNSAVIKMGELGEDAVGLGAIAKAIENNRALATPPQGTPRLVGA